MNQILLNRFYQLLSRKFANEASAAELSELEQLLTDHNELKAFYTNLTVIDNTPLEEETIEAEQAFTLHSTKMLLHDKHLEGKAGLNKYFSYSSNRTRKLLLPILCILLLVIGSIFVTRFVMMEMAGKEITYQIVEVPVGQRVKVTLPDHSVVWLNSKSKFTYPSSFNGNKREVQLDGEGYFDVTHDPLKPFTVITPAHNINVLGTKFNVNAYSESNTFETTLVTGSVKVGDKRNPRSEAVLKPGEKFSFNKKIASYSVSPVDAQNYTSWKDGIYQFNSIAFSEMINELQHYKDVKIIVQDSSILNIICTGKFRQQETIEQILDVIKTDIPFSYTYDKENNTLVLVTANKKDSN